MVGLSIVIVKQKLWSVREAFDQKQIPAWFAEWGHDVAHDWEWWRKQMPYFLGHMSL